jgi:hypothetical protein
MMHVPLSPFSAHLNLLVATLLACAGPAAQAQYKVVGPDGKVSYSDQPAPGATGGRAAVAEAASPAGQLPLEVRQAAGRYPVTLYAGKDCRSCDSGRQLLQQRGVPFTEKRVESSADIAAFKRLSNSDSLPLLTVGAQQLKGLVTADWQAYLDAAGYPKASRLPANWRNPAPTPLAPPNAPAAAAADSPPQDAAAPSAAPGNDATAPRIRF